MLHTYFQIISYSISNFFTARELSSLPKTLHPWGAFWSVLFGLDLLLSPLKDVFIKMGTNLSEQMQILQHTQESCENVCRNVAKFEVRSSAKECQSQSCRA